MDKRAILFDLSRRNIFKMKDFGCKLHRLAFDRYVGSTQLDDPRLEVRMPLSTPIVQPLRLDM
jgi:hypothetical protein